MKKLFLLLLLIFFSSCTADYYFNSALRSESLGEMAEAERLYYKACNMGELAACNNLGVIYAKRGDRGSAVDLYRMACNDNTYAIGCQNLAGMYKDYGVGSYSEAVSAANFACEYDMEVACNILSTLRARQRKFFNDALKGAIEYNNLSE